MNNGVCTICPAGSYCSDNSKYECTIDHYCPEGSSAPTQCVDNSSTNGAIGMAYCTCIDGYSVDSSGTITTTTDECTIDIYQITYNLDGGVVDGTNPATYTIETPTFVLIEPTKDGFAFDGWFDAQGNKIEKIEQGTTGDITLTAQWTEQTTCITPSGTPVAYSPTETLSGVATIETLYSAHSDIITKSGTIYTLKNEEAIGLWKQLFTVEYENGTMTGTAFCGPNGSNPRNQKYYTSDALTAYQAGKGCWCRYGDYNAQTVAGYKWQRASTESSTNVCRTTCPKICAGFTATDEKFRTNLIGNGSTVCLAARETVTCEERVGHTVQYDYQAKECVYTPITYTMTLDSVDGSTGVTNIAIQYGATIDSIDVPTKTDYLFLGYYDENGDMFFDVDGKPLHAIYDFTNNITLTAQWEENMCMKENGMIVWSGENGFRTAQQLLDEKIISKKPNASNAQEYLIDDWENYLSDQKWAVHFEGYGSITGYALCGPRNKAEIAGTVVRGFLEEGQQYHSVIQAYNGCYCRAGTPEAHAVWVAAQRFDGGADWMARTDDCLAGCADVCAEKVATDETFRRAIYDSDICPVGSAEEVFCIGGEYMKDGVCVPVGNGYYSEGGDNDRHQCPDNGITGIDNAEYITQCYKTDAYCETSTGSGTGTCSYDNNGYTNCATCSVNMCKDGYYMDNGVCTICPAGSYCTGGVKAECDKNSYADAEGMAACTPCPQNGLTDTTGATSGAQCYVKDVICEVNGGKGSTTCYLKNGGYGNCDECNVTSCDDGYYMNNGVCTICPAGSYCPAGATTPTVCPADATSDDGATDESDCYHVCKEKNIINGTAEPVSVTVAYPNKCEYHTCKSNLNNPGVVIETANGPMCSELECAFDQQLENGVCVECNVDYAIEYLDNGSNCMVKTCEDGYVPYANSCREQKKECNAPFAVEAYQYWDEKYLAYGPCIIEDCETGRHIDANACELDRSPCNIENGAGEREWDGDKWGTCLVTVCEPGFTENTDGTQCERCENYINTETGAPAVSSYAKGCEIAACMYQGEVYALENNECNLICTYLDDETGHRELNNGRCVRTCNDGYLPW